jgi:hypothetical protein
MRSTLMTCCHCGQSAITDLGWHKRAGQTALDIVRIELLSLETTRRPLRQLLAANFGVMANIHRKAVLVA